MIQALIGFLFRKAKNEAKIQTELIDAIRAKMDTSPEYVSKTIFMWSVGPVGIARTTVKDLTCIAVIQREQNGELNVLMSWMEVNGEITNMDRKGFTADQLVMFALS